MNSTIMQCLKQQQQQKRSKHSGDSHASANLHQEQQTLKRLTFKRKIEKRIILVMVLAVS